MKVLITGATGLVGKEIVKLCHVENIQVNYLTTSKSKLKDEDNYTGFYWNPKHKIIDVNCFQDADAIIHLAGAAVTKRWTTAYKNEIIESRVDATNFLFQTLRDHKHTIKRIISASAIGIYPDSLTNYYDETEAQIDNSFLGRLTQQWEEAVDAFTNLNMNVAKIRIGLVLSDKGGALPQMMNSIKFGLGTAFGSGSQWQSWIHITDLAQLFMFVLQHNLNGIYNGVAPNPVTNNELIKAISRTLHRPILLPNIPKNMMKLILGEMHTLLFLSQRISSKKTEDLGFNFKYHHLQTVLDDLV